MNLFKCGDRSHSHKHTYKMRHAHVSSFVNFILFVVIFRAYRNQIFNIFPDDLHSAIKMKWIHREQTVPPFSHTHDGHLRMCWCVCVVRRAMSNDATIVGEMVEILAAHNKHIVNILLNYYYHVRWNWQKRQYAEKKGGERWRPHPAAAAASKRNKRVDAPVITCTIS